MENSISGEMLAQFLAAKGVKDDCPACGAESSMSLSVYDPEGGGQGSAPAVRLVRRLPGHEALGYGEFLQACTNCGHIRYFRDIEVMAFFDGGVDNG